MKLSTRILKRIHHCGDCGGTGRRKHFYRNRVNRTRFIWVACRECVDWLSALRDVRELESKLTKAWKDPR